MRKTTIIARPAMLTLMFCIAASTMAQGRKSEPIDKDLVGVWVMESMQFEGEKKMECGIDYGQVKVYRADGEYACAEVASDGREIYVLPHEYGTYTFSDGKYTECGRKGTVRLTDKTHFEGTWKNRYDKWRKVTDMPAKLVDYIVDKCRRQNDPKDIQALVRKHILNKKGKARK
ncbi:MAG: hypothetical protein MJY59_04175 [Bacteroidaceae bacterium]|nr:hypothetical protein [Bacteroidaceae bacterium]